MNTLEAKVLELIGESPDSPDVFTDDEEGLAPIRASLSEGIEEIAMLTGSYKRSYFLPLREDRAFYRLRPGRPPHAIQSNENHNQARESNKTRPESAPIAGRLQNCDAACE